MWLFVMINAFTVKFNSLNAFLLKKNDSDNLWTVVYTVLFC